MAVQFSSSATHGGGAGGGGAGGGGGAAGGATAGACFAWQPGTLPAMTDTAKIQSQNLGAKAPVTKAQIADLRALEGGRGRAGRAAPASRARARLARLTLSGYACAAYRAPRGEVEFHLGKSGENPARSRRRNLSIRAPKRPVKVGKPPTLAKVARG